MRAGGLLFATLFAGLLALGVQSELRERRAAERAARLDEALERLTQRPSIQLGVAAARDNAPLDVDALAAQVAERVRRAPPAAAAPPAPTTPEQRRALDGARATFEAALATGRLRRDDVIQMREQLADAERTDETRELLRQMVVAINTDKLVPEDPAFLLP